jgi:uncharacterized protein YdeI (YjbR/CyaY-like superfamily)
MNGASTPMFFATALEFRRWLAKHHRAVSELWVGYYKKSTGRATITWQESVDEALCYGWIDGIRKSVDAESYTNRFTPRRARSVWSAVNTRRANELIAAGRMKAAGLAAFNARESTKPGGSFEQPDVPAFTRAQQAQFKANRAAWAFFSAQPQGYRKRLTWWVASAKQDATQAKRLERLIAEMAAGRKIGLLAPPKTRSSSG